MGEIPRSLESLPAWVSPEQSPAPQPETAKPATSARATFDRICGQLKPRPGEDIKQAAKNFIDSLAQYQDIHINKVNAEAPVSQSVEKIWTEGIAKNLARFASNPSEFERRQADYSTLYRKLGSHADRLVQAGEVSPFVAKTFLENFPALKSSDYYNDLVRNPDKASDTARENYHRAVEELYSHYEEGKTLEQGGFIHFNYKGNENREVKNRLYLSADPAGSPEKLVQTWQEALAETGLQDKIYFKLAGQLPQRYETVIIYQTDDISDDDMGKAMQAFHQRCPESARAKQNMPSSAPIAPGISYAPEPKNLNELFRAMDLRATPHDEVPMRISYNEMIAGFTRLSFELAYRDFKTSQNRQPLPKDLKSGAEKYFEQIVRLAGLNPETMVPNAQGGKLPAWAERIAKESANRQ